MKAIRRIAASTQCPKCNAFDGYNYNALQATCKKCGYIFDVYDLFEETLLTKQDSNLWSFPFTLISQFGLAEIFEGIIHDEDIKLKPFEQIEIDFKKAGLPENAKILYINISPYTKNNNSNLILAFAYLRGYDTLSISDIPSVVRIIPIPPAGANNTYQIPSDYLNAAIMVRWHLKNGNGIVSDHVIRAAEAYWKNDLNQMIYNGFSAFELSLSNLVEDFWKNKKQLSDPEYGEFFDRSSVDKKIRTHIPLMCRELSIVYDDNVRRKISIINQLRLQRNSVVHEGQIDPNRENNKGKLFASFVWGLLFLKEIQARL